MQKGVDIDFDWGYILFGRLHFHEEIKLNYISIKDVYTHIILSYRPFILSPCFDFIDSSV